MGTGKQLKYDDVCVKGYLQKSYVIPSCFKGPADFFLRRYAYPLSNQCVDSVSRYDDMNHRGHINCYTDKCPNVQYPIGNPLRVPVRIHTVFDSYRNTEHRFRNGFVPGTSKHKKKIYWHSASLVMQFDRHYKDEYTIPWKNNRYTSEIHDDDIDDTTALIVKTKGRKYYIKQGKYAYECIKEHARLGGVNWKRNKCEAQWDKPSTHRKRKKQYLNSGIDLSFTWFEPDHDLIFELINSWLKDIYRPNIQKHDIPTTIVVTGNLV